MRRRQSQRGFTLIEMMVVVAIISILVALAVNLRTTTYGANTSSVSDQLVSQLSFARERAIATRRYHKVNVTPQLITIYQGDTLGMAAPATYSQLQTMSLPNAVSVWAASATVIATTGNVEVQNLALSFDMYLAPDGSSRSVTGALTGATLFVTDVHQASSYRVLLYKVTGTAIARTPW